MPRASEIKRGNVIEHDGTVYAVRQIDRSAPTARGGGTLFRFKLHGIPGGERRELTCKGDDVLREADLVRRQSSFSYRDADGFVFMDDEDFRQHLVSEADVGEAAGYITDGLGGIFVLLIDDVPVAIDLPQSVVLEVTDTAPVMKGATATKSNKPATLETGIEVMVPDYITPGEKIKVNTETGEFMSRA
ncbi:elongation factor P-like protein YeiP [Wenzhouxiangella sp. AB-CW3]|uniref:elongation factor P-like protein EfpL n=1 Tax=Wenzhouxiangella sp. AB-CW3 TaxID=2771012 RepID=UPI00168BB568|nr:elongation factor P-like protein YeiP [Wenzhouxiangella sp. AB-CW3]QOC21410.1 elongation factor P-like protein YeiP [Wenzhouxiangella sp. AB-CW3]